MADTGPSFAHTFFSGVRMSAGSIQILFMGAIIYWLIIGLIAGIITGKVMHSPGRDWFSDMIVGILGAIVGGFVMQLLGFSFSAGFIYNILVAIFGAVVLTWLYRKVRAHA